MKNLKYIDLRTLVALWTIAFAVLSHHALAEDASFPPEWALSWERATIAIVSSWQDPHGSGKPANLELIPENCLKGSAPGVHQKNTAKLHEKGEMDLTFMWISFDGDINSNFMKSINFCVPPKDRNQVVAFEKWLEGVKDGSVRVLPWH